MATVGRKAFCLIKQDCEMLFYFALRIQYSIVFVAYICDVYVSIFLRKLENPWMPSFFAEMSSQTCKQRRLRRMRMALYASVYGSSSQVVAIIIKPLQYCPDDGVVLLFFDLRFTAVKNTYILVCGSRMGLFQHQCVGSLALDVREYKAATTAAVVASSAIAHMYKSNQLQSDAFFLPCIYLRLIDANAVRFRKRIRSKGNEYWVYIHNLHS